MKLTHYGLAIGLGIATIASSTSFSSAQDFPNDTVRIIVGSSPGGGTDLIARTVAAELSTKWGVPVIVENAPGAANTIAGQAVASAPPDGHTLWVSVSQFTITPHTMELPYQFPTAFEPVAALALNTQILVVNPDFLPVTSVEELVTYAQENPGQLNFGSAGPGSPPFIGMQVLMSERDFEMTNVTYQGGAPAIAALLSGETELQMATVGGTLSHVQDGKLVALAVSTNVRSEMLPDVPTMEEAAGLDDFDIRSWYAMFAPAGTPPDVIEKINEDVRDALNSEAVATTYATMGLELFPHLTPSELDAYLEEDLAKWGGLLATYAPEVLLAQPQ